MNRTALHPPVLAPLALAALLGCAPPVPTLNLPAAPPASHAEALDLARLLTPTALGASDDTLCPWARGEASTDQSVQRWIAEKRLVFRVLALGEASTFAGGPLSEAKGLADAARALETRCGATLGRDYLIAAGPQAEVGQVFDGVYALGQAQFDAPWVLVDGPVPAPAPLPADPPARRDGAPLDLAAALAAGPQRSVTLAVGDPPKVFDETGQQGQGLAEALAARPTCVIATASLTDPWAALVALVDAARGVGAEVLLARHANEDAVGAGLAPPSGAVVSFPGQVPALPLTVPRTCGTALGCGCTAGFLGAESGQAEEAEAGEVKEIPRK